MRKITDHKLNGLNDALVISVVDAPGHGGASHKYRIRPEHLGNESDVAGTSQRMGACCDINFQNGPLNEHGVNGISQEALIAVVIDRLRSFQEGQYKCRENAIALTHFEEGLMWLQKRTRDRIARGVEGTSAK